MKHLIQLITEGDIDRCERKYREFVNMCKTYDPNINMKEVWVKKTTKNNWAVYVGLKKMFITSFSCLDDDVIERNKIKLVKEDVNESYKDRLHKYEIMFLQYDPDVLEEYENGDVTDDDLHDSAYEGDIDRVQIGALDDQTAIRKATKELAKVVNKHSEIVAASVYHDNADDGDIVETIFI